MGVAFSTYRREERGVQGLVGNPEVRRLLGKSRYVYEDNIRIDIK
jgi:hypothetical protein